MQALSGQLEELRAEKAGLEAALASCQSELNEVLEDRWVVCQLVCAVPWGSTALDSVSLITGVLRSRMECTACGMRQWGVMVSGTGAGRRVRPI